MDVSGLVPFIFPLLLAGAAFFFRESIKSVIARTISSLTKDQVNAVFLVLLVAFTGIAWVAGNSIMLAEKDKPLVVEPQKIQAKTDAEVIFDGVEKAYDEIKDGVNKKRTRDSIAKANRRHVWVYQIGQPKHLDEAWELYKQLKDVPGVCFFKQSKRNYIVIKMDNGSSDSELLASMETFKQNLPEVNEEVRIVDLMTECSKREDFIEDDRIRLKKEKLEARCFICD